LNFALVAVLPILIIGFASHTLLTRSLSEAIAAKNLSLSRALSGEVDAFLSHPLSILKQVIDVVDGQEVVASKSLDEFLGIVVENFDLFDMIQILDSTGKVVFVAPYDREFISNNMSNLPFYQATLERKGPFWSPTFISMQTGQPTLTLSLPMKNGMLIGYLNLNILTDITEKVDVGGQGYVIITDQAGRTLAHPDRRNVSQQLNLKNLSIIQEGLAGHEGTFRDFVQQNEVIGSIAIVPQTKWLVVIIQESSEAFASVLKIRLVIVVGVICTAILAILFALGSLRKTLQPFSFLVSDLRKVAGGNYEFPGPVQSGYSEIKELSETFGQMAIAVKDRERSIRARERQYRSLVAAIPYGILENDLDGVITFANSSYERIMECRSEEMIGQPIWATTINESEKAQLQKYIVSIVEDRPDPMPYHTKALTRKGNIIDIRVDWDYRRDEGGKQIGFISVVTDTTLQKRLEENLRQAHKMEAVGTLAGGIAHDFNNILAAILGYSQLVMEDLPKESKNREDMESVISAGNRAKDLVQHMLTFSRKTEQDVGPVEVHLILEEALKLLRASIPSTIEIKQNIDSGAGIILADPTQIHQVVMNLCTNATHAMEKTGGVLEVILDRVALTEDDLAAEPNLLPGEFLRIGIKDSGVGIGESDMSRVFDPYFTTKGPGKGTGMGLSVVHGIAKSLGGTVKVESRPGHGASFDVYFPRMAAEAEQAEIEQGEFVPPAGNERILVVDDEIDILNVAKTRLERLGYSVTPKISSSDALESFRSKPDAFDLVITDQTMPGMTGDQLSKQILAIRSDIPIILCTGFSATVDKEEALDIGIRAFVMKPVSLKEMSILVRDLLNGKEINDPAPE
jgi:two-component system, cell cycle sensor histidine kinase and response regulator CckA